MSKEVNLIVKVDIDISEALEKLELLKNKCVEIKNINVTLDNNANISDIVNSLNKKLKITTINSR